MVRENSVVPESQKKRVRFARSYPKKDTASGKVHIFGHQLLLSSSPASNSTLKPQPRSRLFFSTATRTPLLTRLLSLLPEPRQMVLFRIIDTRRRKNQFEDYFNFIQRYKEQYEKYRNMLLKMRALVPQDLRNVWSEDVEYVYKEWKEEPRRALNRIRVAMGLEPLPLLEDP